MEPGADRLGGMSRQRLIAYVDLPGLPAAVEQRQWPRWRGQPLVVTTEAGRRVLAASPEAGARGIRPGMTVWEACYRCPELGCVPEDQGKYRHFLARALAVAAEYTPAVEAAGSTGLWADLTGTGLLFGPPEGPCRRILARLEREVGARGRCGLGPSKTAARIAAGLAQIGGVRRLGEQDLVQELGALPVGMLPEAPEGLQEAMRALGLRTLGDLAALPPAEIGRAFGEAGEALARLARGEDEEPLRLGGPPAVRRLEELLPLEPGSDDPGTLRAGLLLLCERVGGRLREAGRTAGSLHLGFGFRNYRELEFIRRLSPPTCLEGALFAGAREVLERLRLQGRQVSLLRLTAVGLRRESVAGQLTLEMGAGMGPERRRVLAGAVDRVRGRYGEGALSLAGARRESVRAQAPAPPATWPAVDRGHGHPIPSRIPARYARPERVPALSEAGRKQEQATAPMGTGTGPGPT